MLSQRLAGLSCAALLVGCVFGLSPAAASAGTLKGAGSSLVHPIEAEWAAAWERSTGNVVNYQAVASEKGERDIANGLVDFGASDAPLSVYSSAPSHLVQIPWALSAVGVSYHLNGVRTLHLTGSLIGAIYLGHIKNWDDPAIAARNRGLHLPNLPITVFWSDGSGETFVLTRYLSDVSSRFKSAIGNSTTVSWPIGHSAEGNPGMVQGIRSTNGAIGYIAVPYLIAAGLPAAAILNAAGRYEVPNLSAIENAGAVVHSVPANNEVTIVGPPRDAMGAYPISTFTYVFVPTNASQGHLLKDFIGYALTGGQSEGPRLGYAPLPRDVLRADQATLARVS